jgi:LPXTG-motif cell wall-anchored protein
LTAEAKASATAEASAETNQNVLIFAGIILISGAVLGFVVWRRNQKSELEGGHADLYSRFTDEELA